MIWLLESIEIEFYYKKKKEYSWKSIVLKRDWISNFYFIIYFNSFDKIYVLCKNKNGISYYAIWEKNNGINSNEIRADFLNKFRVIELKDLNKNLYMNRCIWKCIYENEYMKVLICEKLTSWQHLTIFGLQEGGKNFEKKNPPIFLWVEAFILKHLELDQQSLIHFSCKCAKNWKIIKLKICHIEYFSFHC